jgi:hypothetical protein
MKTIYPPMTLGRGILAGLFVGIIASVLIIAYNVIYRGAEDFLSYAVVMPVSIFFFFPIFSLAVGGIYFLFLEHMKKGREFYIIVVLAVTALIALFTAFAGRHSDPALEKFRGLLLGLEVIEGCLAAFFIPFFANHPNWFLTDKDIRGEE